MVLLDLGSSSVSYTHLDVYKRQRQSSPGPRIPQGVITASEWSWRVIVIAAVVAGFWWLLQYFSGVAVPLAVAVLLTALLAPLNGRLREWSWPAALAAAGSLLATAVVVIGVFIAIGAQVAREFPQLLDKSVIAFHTLVDWLASGPLAIDQAQLDGYLQSFTAWVNDSRAELAAVAASAGVGVGHFFAGLAIALIASFFFLASGRHIWASMLTLVPRHYQVATDRAAERGWTSLVAYMRAQVLVALVEDVYKRQPSAEEISRATPTAPVKPTRDRHSRIGSPVAFPATTEYSATAAMAIATRTSEQMMRSRGVGPATSRHSVRTADATSRIAVNTRMTVMNAPPPHRSRGRTLPPGDVPGPARGGVRARRRPDRAGRTRAGTAAGGAG